MPLRRMSRNGRVALLALGSLVVLLDAGAKYSGWSAAAFGDERTAVQHDALSVAGAPSSYAPHRFRVGSTLSLDGMSVRCVGDEPLPDPASQTSDDSLDINCGPGTTVKAVGDLPRTELQSWPGDSRYDRAVRF